MSINIVFLGTAGSVPTIKRSLPAIAIQRKGLLLLFDCGEGVQRQMIMAGLGFNRDMKIFITHLHGDHLFGLPGLIQTMSLLGRTRKLEIYGPSGVEDLLKAIEDIAEFRLCFPLGISEIENEGIVYENKEFQVNSVFSNHLIPSFAYSVVEKSRPGKFYPEKAKDLGIPEGLLWSKLQHGEAIRLENGKVIEPGAVIGPTRPGRKIVYTGDTAFSESLIHFSKNADVLIHECTFDDDLTERAIRDGHATPTQAATIASESGVKRLILTHVSARYKTADLLLTQAKKLFKSVIVAEDLMKIVLPLKK